MPEAEKNLEFIAPLGDSEMPVALPNNVYGYHEAISFDPWRNNTS